MPDPRTLVQLCTYNERDNLAPLVAEIRAVLPEADILVVDDSSPDGTGELADELTAADPAVHVLHRDSKAGLGAAIVAGLQWGLSHNYDRLINLDADFSHPTRFLPAMLAASGERTVAVASRYVPGGRIEGWGPLRHFMSRGINAYARLLLGLPTRDCSGSYRCYPAAILRRLDFGLVRSRGYAFQEEILYRCRKAGASFEEVPIVFEERRAGESKITLKEATSALHIIARLALDRLTRKPVSPLGE